MRDHKQILIVEDETIIALDIRAKLDCLGYSVPAIVTSGEQALQKTAELYPDLVLMDIHLRGKMDGVEAAEQIRQQFRIPVVFLTAYADEVTLQRAKLTEAFGYLIKPFEERELRTAIEMALYKHKMEQRLQESERWLATTLNSIGDAVIATDGRGHVRFMNPVAQALTGWSGEEACGEELNKVFITMDSKTMGLVENPVTVALREKRVVSIGDGGVLMDREGMSIPIDDSAAPIRDDTGRVSGAVLVFRDVSDRRRAEEAARQYLDKLQVRNKELEVFAQVLAHDLQRPLNVVARLAEQVISTQYIMPAQMMQDHLQLINHHVRKMSSSIDNLLLLAQVGRGDTERKILTMASIVHRAQQRLADLIEESQAKILQPAAADWPQAWGYAPWIEEVWVHYLSNALKHGGQPPRLTLGAAPATDGLVRFWIQDNGPGLPPEALAQVFGSPAPFGQGHPRQQGLGLSVVRSLVECLDGQVSVESEGVPGRGCVFSFTLPAARS